MDIGSTKVALEGRRWEKDLPELGDLEVLVAPWENKAFDRVMQKQIGLLPPGLRPDGRVEPAAYYRCLGVTIARTILFDWKNANFGNGDVAFDAAFAETVLINPEYRVLRDGIVAAARRVQQNVKATEDDLAGKSLPISPGNETGAPTPTK